MTVDQVIEHLQGQPGDAEVIFESREHHGELDVYGSPVEHWPNSCRVEMQPIFDRAERKRTGRRKAPVIIFY